MRRVIKTLGIMLICGILCMPQIEARGRNNGSATSGSTTSRQHSAGRPSQSGSNRPNPSRNQGQRPGNSGSHQGQRPGNSGSHHDKHHTGGYHPGHHPGGGYRPSTPPPSHHNHGHHHHSHGYHHHSRPHLPPPCPYHRPTPPPHYVYSGYWSPIRTVLGIAFGTALDISVNALIRAGYTVAGYDRDIVYLSNVRMLNMLWPDGTLYYNSSGLIGSSFVYSTPGYDTSRYNLVYSILSDSYGVPVSVENISSGITATWYGGGQYIQLSFQNNYAVNGSSRYYTTLSFGN